MFCRVLSSALTGIEGVPVQIELDIGRGMPCFVMVGSLSSQIKESQDRVRTALRNLDIHIPPKRIIVNIAPAEIKKDGTRFDLPIAAALLYALEVIPEGSLDGCMVIGELRLNGDTQGVPGILPSVLNAKKEGIRTCVVPLVNAEEASASDGIEVIGVRNLRELIDYCRALPGKSGFVYRKKPPKEDMTLYPDFADIKGQTAVKRACMIAAAGFHNILMSGPPGSGKSMAAKRIPSIMPAMTQEEQLEVSGIYSVAGLLPEERPLITQRPFRAPHYSLSPQALCGGGRIPRPGEITLAHRGVLFIDELPEMPGRTLETLRAPLEEKKVLISRSGGRFTFPADFLFAAAMNPCPCGHFPNMQKCTCSAREIHNYMSRLSRPIMDRIDIRVDVPAPTYNELVSSAEDNISSADIRKKVGQAFEIQKERFRSRDMRFNSSIAPGDIALFCEMTDEARRFLEKTYESMDLSARAYHRILKLSRTIADLENDDIINTSHLSEAFVFRARSYRKEI